MGLTEILEIIILAALAALGVLIIVTSRRKNGADDGENTLTADAVGELIHIELEETREMLLSELRRDQAAVKADLLSEIRASRTETVNTVQTSVDRLGGSLRENQKAVNDAQNDRITTLTEMLDKRQTDMQTAVVTLLDQKMSALTESVSLRLGHVEKQFADFSSQSREAQESTRKTMEERLSEMQKQNGEQLDKMRETVDEKLQKTLDERISQSFKLVNERLTEVYQGLGEMKTLAGSVGDLKKVMSGVKTRGILGEIQLGAIVEDMLTPDQYEKNTVTKPGTSNPVEYAVRLPGDGEGTVLLPIDAKFPGDTYAHLMDAYETADPNAVREAQKQLAATVKSEAKDIRDKYIDPPHTTPFGVMFLPFEGLYAEVVRLGLVEELRQKYQVTVAGPTTLSALLNSLQMGFRTLAIQKRSGEVWNILGAVKTEFASFADVLTAVQKRLEQTGVELDKLVGVRTRKINLRLKSVSELPADESALLLGEEGVPAETGE